MMSFLYPQEFNHSWDKYQRMASIQKQRESLPEESASGAKHIEELDFSYKIKGKARWKPLRVYNDGVRTVIQMPDSLSQAEAPVLLVLDEHDEEKLVNSRLKGTAYIVDQVFDKAVLIVGVGRKQTRVTIEKV
jgi:type IV secretion system protein VirB9